MKFKKTLVPFLCLVISVLMIYARPLIPHDSSALTENAEADRLLSSSDIITVHYHERPPYYTTGPLGVYGLCCDPAKLAFKKAGIKYKWEKTPAGRQLDILKENRSKECIIGWFKNPEREKFAKYTYFIYQDKPTIALARSDNYNLKSGISLEEALQNKKLTLLRKNGYSYGHFIDKKISELQPNYIITNSENIGMLKMIHARRADYFFISEEEAVAMVATSGLLETEFKLIKFKNVPEGNKRYLLFSKSVDDEILQRVNKAIKKYVHNRS